jgi:hypothetical protein
LITDYSQKKLAEYLKPGDRALIRFGHGLGDTLMFMPAFESLRELHPEVAIDLYVESGQEEIWDSVADKDADGYDHVFHLDFPMSEGTGKTKLELCCETELGIDPPYQEVAWVRSQFSPLVGVHFHGTALPESVNCPEAVARQIWEEILHAGRIPIECHFEHIFHNPSNEKFSWIDRDVRGCRADLHNLFGLVQRLGAFIGVASGPWVVALAWIPARTMLLENRHTLGDYVRVKKTHAVHINDYQPGMVLEWLKEISS